MKKIFLLAILLQVSIAGVQSQNVAINTTGAVANASAMLDVSSTSSGVLIPRMTTAQRTAIASPANGLQVFDTDRNCNFVYLSATSTWRSLCDVYGPVYGQNTLTTGTVAGTNDLRSISVTTNNATDKVVINAEMDYWKGGTQSYVVLCVFRNGTIIHEVSNISTANADNFAKLSWVDTPGLGTFTYNIRWYMGAGGMSGIYGSSISALVYQ